MNCNAHVYGRYCHICGQENLEPAESVWHLIVHFFNDVTHFDGKFFSTLKYLIVKPGFLSREYMAGRRMNYLNPVRMYLFTSAFFFLIFFNFLTNDERKVEMIDTHYGIATDSIRKMDTLTFKNFSKSFNEKIPRNQKKAMKYFDSIDNKVGFSFTDTSYASLKDYQQVLKDGKRHHNWLQKKLIFKQIELNDKYNHNKKRILNEVKDKLKHSFPQILFVTLPLFALLLKLLYIRRKNFYYTNHLIFTFHLYIFYFIGMLVSFSLEKISSEFQLPFLAFLYVPINFFLVIYCYKAMRNFYLQSRGKTFLKFMILFFLFSLLIGIITGIYFLLSFFKV